VNNNPPSSRSALRQLLIVLVVLVGVAFYAYGWNTTDISLDEVQDETRQSSVQRAMRELLSPDIFTRIAHKDRYLSNFGLAVRQVNSPMGAFRSRTVTMLTSSLRRPVPNPTPWLI